MPASPPSVAREILGRLRCHGPALASDLTDVLGRPRGSVGAALNRLDAEGAVESEPRDGQRGFLWSATGEWAERDLADLDAILDAYGLESVVEMTKRRARIVSDASEGGA